VGKGERRPVGEAWGKKKKKALEQKLAVRREKKLKEWGRKTGKELKDEKKSKEVPKNKGLKRCQTEKKTRTK